MASLNLDLSGIDRLEMQLSKIGSTDISLSAVEAGMKPLADEIRKNLNNLPEDTFRRLGKGEVFVGVPKNQKKDLQESLGVTPSIINRNGDADIKVGFDGYGSYPTKKYPKGVPNALLARSVESGSSVRKKTPFIRPAVDKIESKVIKAMQEQINKEVEKIQKGN